MSHSASVSEEARRIHEDSIVIDGCTFFCEGYNDQLAQAGVTALNLTTPDVDADAGWAVREIASTYQVIREDPKLILIEAVDDIFRVKEGGGVGIIIAFQNARPMADNRAMVEVFYRLGVRVSLLSYNGRNFAADGCGTGADAGLSRDGRALVREMNRIGMVVDLSHVGARSSMEAIEISEKPCIFSHSNSRSRVNALRNTTDEHMKRVAAKGGVVGLTTYPPLNWRGGEAIPTLDDYLDNVEHAIDLIGIEHVSIGTDTEATPGAYPREYRRRLGRRLADTLGGYREAFQGNPEARHLDGFASMADWPLITQGLHRRGYDEESIRKVLGLNLIRVFREVWQ